MILTVEHSKKDESIEIYLDQEGLDYFIQKLNKLKKNKGHDHLKTDSWGGNELTEQIQGQGNELINHLCIVLKP